MLFKYSVMNLLHYPRFVFEPSTNIGLTKMTLFCLLIALGYFFPMLGTPSLRHCACPICLDAPRSNFLSLAVLPTSLLSLSVALTSSHTHSSTPTGISFNLFRNLSPYVFLSKILVLYFNPASLISSVSALNFLKR